MGLFSKSGKNKQDAGQDSGYYTSADDQAMTERARAKRASSADGPKRRAREREEDDPVLPEKKRARRRLVGAIMLALLVAVGLPMLLDSEPKPLSSDIDIKIPSKDKPSARAAEPAAQAPAAAALDSKEELVDDSVKPAAKSAPAPAAAAVAPVVAAVDTSKQEADARAKADAKAEALAKAKAEHEQKEQERKLADAKAEAKLKADKQEAERKLAEAKAAKAAEKPVEKPAEKVAEKPAAKSEDARALAILEGKPATAEKFVLQVAALSDQAKADELRAKLKNAGISSFTQKTPSGITRVRVGPFSSKEEAEKVKAKLSSMGLEGRLETV
jgi:DedD protein